MSQTEREVYIKSADYSGKSTHFIIRLEVDNKEQTFYVEEYWPAGSQGVDHIVRDEDLEEVDDMDILEAAIDAIPGSQSRLSSGCRTPTSAKASRPSSHGVPKLN